MAAVFPYTAIMMRCAVTQLMGFTGFNESESPAQTISKHKNK